jgi:hypothetical protein
MGTKICHWFDFIAIKMTFILFWMKWKTYKGEITPIWIFSFDMNSTWTTVTLNNFFQIRMDIIVTYRRWELNGRRLWYFWKDVCQLLELRLLCQSHGLQFVSITFWTPEYSSPHLMRPLLPIGHPSCQDRLQMVWDKKKILIDCSHQERQPLEQGHFLIAEGMVL